MMARLAFGMSVMNIWPGAWVIMNSGLTAMATACGVTPHAQKTGTSPGRISEGSPKSGLSMSWMPMASGPSRRRRNGAP